MGLVVFLLSSGRIYAQDQEQELYDREFAIGINKNSAGGFIGGIFFKKSYRIHKGALQTYGIELMNVKSVQEKRRTNPAVGNAYVYGKSNYLYTIRFQYGRDIVLFRRAPYQGVEIKAVYAAGLSTGFLLPYYIVWVSRDGYTTREPYDHTNPNHTVDKIIDHGTPFEGIGETKLQLGLNFKAALNFEMGISSSTVTGFEIGVSVDSYAKKIPLVPAGQDKAIFPAVFISIYTAYQQ